MGVFRRGGPYSSGLFGLGFLLWVRAGSTKSWTRLWYLNALKFGIGVVFGGISLNVMPEFGAEETTASLSKY